MRSVPLESALVEGERFVPVVTGLGLTEAPWYDAEAGAVCFSDVTQGGVWRYFPDSGEVEQVVAHRRGIGGLVGNADGRLLIAGKTVALKDLGSAATDIVCSPDDVGEGVIGFNDLCADAAGRVYVGALTFLPLSGRPSPGAICVIERDRRMRVVADDVVLPNGMAFDPDSSLLYVCDSELGHVAVYRCAANGDLELAHTIPCADGGRPDGLALTTDGSLWVAQADGAVVDVLDVSGEVHARWPFPGGAVTNLCFGGPRFDTLFATGGGIPPDDRPGGLWATRTSATGRGVARAAV